MFARASKHGFLSGFAAVPIVALSLRLVSAQSAPVAVRDDLLVRMPGTQPHQVALQGSTECYACHGSGAAQWVRPTPDTRGRTDYGEYEIFKAWQGSMMSNSARDPLMFVCLTVAAQDSKFAIGNANAVDLCLRCHFPKGWLEGSSDPPNVSAMHGERGLRRNPVHVLPPPERPVLPFDDQRQPGRP